jgi:hypothetical protein
VKPPFKVSLGSLDLVTKLRKILNRGNLTLKIIDLGSLKLDVKCGKIVN